MTTRGVDQKISCGGCSVESSLAWPLVSWLRQISQAGRVQQLGLSCELNRTIEKTATQHSF